MNTQIARLGLNAMQTEREFIDAIGCVMSEYRTKFSDIVLHQHRLPFTQYERKVQELITETKDKVFDIVHASEIFPN